MNNTFNMKRAGNFFVYDLKTAKNNFLMSLIICGLMPAICFAFAMVFSLLLNQSPAEVAAPLQFLAVFVGTVIAIVNFPVKQYGALTDKKYGSDWLMLPASGFEKWLSMILMSFIVFPVCLFGLMLFTDWLLSVVFPSNYPQAIIAYDFLTTLSRIGGDTSELADLFPNFHWGLEIFISFGSSVLFFVLGAVFFKRSKFAKSLLVLFALSTLFSFISMAVFGTSSFDEETILRIVDGEDLSGFMRKFLDVCRLINAFWIALLGAGLYFRIKTLKH